MRIVSGHRRVVSVIPERTSPVLSGGGSTPPTSDSAWMGRVSGVSTLGTTITFEEPFASDSSYLPTIVGYSADMTRNVEVRVTLRASSMDLVPAESGAIIYWKVEAL